MPQPLTDEEIAQRMPVWVAFADLFLDTDPALHYRSIVRVMRDSTFTSAQLRQILCDEVSPAFEFNLSLIAGEWAMWTEEYVRRRMLRSLQVARKAPHWLARHFRSRANKYAAEQWDRLTEFQRWVER